MPTARFPIRAVIPVTRHARTAWPRRRAGEPPSRRAAAMTRPFSDPEWAARSEERLLPSRSWITRAVALGRHRGRLGGRGRCGRGPVAPRDRGPRTRSVASRRRRRVERERPFRRGRWARPRAWTPDATCVRRRTPRRLVAGLRGGRAEQPAQTVLLVLRRVRAAAVQGLVAVDEVGPVGAQPLHED